MSDHQLIAPERQGLWTVAAFVLALFAFILAVVGIYRTNTLLYGTQIEVLALNKKIESMRQATPPAPVAAAEVKAEAAK